MQENQDNNISFLLGQLTTKVDGLDKKLDAFQAGLGRRIEDHEKRLRVVEKVVWKMSAVSGVIGGIAVAALNYMMGHIKS
jgi:hypothetical protein